MQTTNQPANQTSIRFFFLVITFNFILFILVSGFFNQFLFILHGFDLKLIKGTSTESFNAYRKVYNSKLPFLIFLMGLSIISFFWIIRLEHKLNRVIYSILFLVFGVVVVTSLAFVFFFCIIPTNVIQ
jgi:hypothetical protein